MSQNMKKSLLALLAFALIGDVVSGDCLGQKNTTIALTPMQINAKMITAALVDSVETQKRTRSFNLQLSYAKQKDLHSGFLHIVKSTINNGEKKFYDALSKIFGEQNVSVPNEALDQILASAKDGFKDASDIVMAAYGNNFSDIEEDDYDNLKEMIKLRLEGLLEISSSEEWEISVDEDLENSINRAALSLELRETIWQLLGIINRPSAVTEEDLKLTIEYDFERLSKAAKFFNLSELRDNLQSSAESLKNKDTELYNKLIKILKQRLK